MFSSKKPPVPLHAIDTPLVESMHRRGHALYNAVSVIVNDDKIRAWLAENDPKALGQCVCALEMSEKQPTQAQTRKEQTMLMQPVPVSVLKQAISLRISKSFPAMSVANAIGGSYSPAWDLARRVRLAELVADALDRGLDVRNIKEVDGTPFCDTAAYLRVRDEIGGRPDFPR